MTLPFARLGGFYALFFAVLGLLSPYWGPYLREQGYDAAAIGILIAIIHATKIIAPNLWGWIADHTGQRVWVIRIACGFGLVGFCGVFLDGGFLWMALVMATFSFFWNATLPQMEALTFSHLQTDTHRYPRIRLWGTVGFMAAVLLGGEAVDFYGAGVVPVMIGVLLLALALLSLSLPASQPAAGARGGMKLWPILSARPVIGLFLACFLLQASHGPFYAFYSIYLQDHGYSGLAIGLLWAVALTAEIIVFLMMPRLLPRLGARRLLIAAMLLAVLRWVLVASFAHSALIQGAAQLLHAATYGVYHATAISLVNRYFLDNLQGRGQALYSSLTFGAGVAVGSYLAGMLWQPIGGAATYYLAAVVAAAGGLVAFWMVSGHQSAEAKPA